MSRARVPLLALARLALGTVASPLLAQTASMTASATVSDVTISIDAAQELQFGGVAPGTPTYVDPKTSATAGLFEIRGARRAEFTLSMLLPMQLTTGAGPHAMPITFGAAGACYRDRSQRNQCAYYDPAITLVNRLRNDAFPNNTFYVWVGGTVSPSAAQFPGVYAGLITASVAYTGN